MKPLEPITEEHADQMLETAHIYALAHSTCSKVKVGSIIETIDGATITGCNHGVCNCRVNGCRRIKLYGDASKEHRLPSDCDSVHSEVDAICAAAKIGLALDGATIYVTRYPCEACARAIAQSGIRRVVYGRKESISSYTTEILGAAGVEIYKRFSFNKEDNNA